MNEKELCNLGLDALYKKYEKILKEIDTIKIQQNLEIALILLQIKRCEFEEEIECAKGIINNLEGY